MVYDISEDKEYESLVAIAEKYYKEYLLTTDGNIIEQKVDFGSMLFVDFMKLMKNIDPNITFEIKPINK